jgi:glutaredoxin
MMMFGEELSNIKGKPASSTTHRRKLIEKLFRGSMASIGIAALLSPQQPAQAAPPIAVIAEELGYFPVTNREGQMVYVPKRVQRQSSEQAIALAKKMTQAGAVMYGAYWCPHCARQKELFGREAFQYITYVECSPKGFGAQPTLCLKQDVDGYPTWIFGDKKVLGGERNLEELAKQVDAPFRPDLEQNVPPPLGSSSCKQS